MPLPSALFLAPLVLLNFEDRAVTRVRTFVGDDVFVDAVDTARAGLSYSNRVDSFQLSYTPTLSFLSIGTPTSQVTLFHNVDATFTRQFRHGSISLQESVSGGQTNFRINPPGGIGTPQAPTTTPGAPLPGDIAPQPPTGTTGQGPTFDQVVWFGSTATSLTLIQTPVRRWAFQEYGSYSVRGGLDSEARDFYPVQQQILAGVSLGHELTRQDSLSTSLGGQRTATGGLAQAYIGTLRETYAHVFSSRATGRISGGLAYTRQRNNSLIISEGFYPVGSIDFNSQLGRRPGDLSLNVGVGTTPVVDWFTGIVDPRLLWNLNLTRTQGDFSFVLGSTGMWSFTQASNSLAMGGLGTAFAFEMTPQLFFNVGAYGSWQFYQVAANSPLLLSGFVGLTFRPEPLQL